MGFRPRLLRSPGRPPWTFGFWGACLGALGRLGIYAPYLALLAAPSVLMVAPGTAAAQACDTTPVVISGAKDTLWAVPANCDSVTVKAWGGGGAGGGADVGDGGAGGGGGFAYSVIGVTANDTLNR